MLARPPASPFSPLLQFLRSEGAGGAMLIAAAAVALVWANSRFGVQYEALLHWTPPLPGRMQLHVWINDGLMALFFLLVGLELRREVTSGELATPEQLAAPTIAAVGGMVVPALIFMAFNWGKPEPMRGWAVPVATDIAFALAVANALGQRFPLALKVFLTALAIIDDLGAILIIAFFYSKGLDFWMLGGAALALAVLYGLNRTGVRPIWPYLLGGVAVWTLVLKSGVHATLAGVALAMVIPIDARAGEDDAPAMRLERTLHPWVSYLVLPVFGLANAGLSFDGLPAGGVDEHADAWGVFGAGGGQAGRGVRGDLRGGAAGGGAAAGRR